MSQFATEFYNQREKLYSLLVKQERLSEFNLTFDTEVEYVEKCQLEIEQFRVKLLNHITEIAYSEPILNVLKATKDLFDVGLEDFDHSGQSKDVVELIANAKESDWYLDKEGDIMSRLIHWQLIFREICALELENQLMKYGGPTAVLLSTGLKYKIKWEGQRQDLARLFYDLSITDWIPEIKPRQYEALGKALYLAFEFNEDPEDKKLPPNKRSKKQVSDTPWITFAQYFKGTKEEIESADGTSRTVSIPKFADIKKFEDIKDRLEKEA